MPDKRTRTWQIKELDIFGKAKTHLNKVQLYNVQSSQDKIKCTSAINDDSLKMKMGNWNAYFYRGQWFVQQLKTQWQKCNWKDTVVSGSDLYRCMGCTILRVELCVEERVKTSEFAIEMQHRTIKVWKSLPKQEKLGLITGAIDYKILYEMQDAVRAKRAS